MAEGTNVYRTREELLAHQNQLTARVSRRDAPITYDTAYYTHEGVTHPIYAYLPNPEAFPGPRPGILFFYGGGFRVGTPHAFREHAEICARQGYAAFCPDYRIGSVCDCTPRDGITDGAAAWRFLREHAADWNVDPERMAISGGSAGGLIAAMCGVLSGSFPRCLVLFNPGFLDKDMGPESLGNIIGTEADGHPLANPNFLQPGMPPMLILHGELDKTVPRETMEQFAARAGELGIEAKLILYPGVGHGFFNFNRSRAHFHLTVGEMLLFLEKTLTE